MAYSTNLFKSNNTILEEPSLEGFEIGRVSHVILRENDKELKKYGLNAGIGAIKYMPLGSSLDPEKIETHPEAFPRSSTFRTYPFKNEIVLISKGPSSSLGYEGTDRDRLDYYTNTLAVWNNAHSNPLVKDSPVDLGNGIEEQAIASLHPFPGDTIIRGRLGQNMRIGGEDHPKNKITDSSNAGKPFMLLSNIKYEGEDNFIVEDINRDYSSFYLTSEHKINLEQARTKYDSTNTKPTRGNRYKGSQAIINSDRVFINSKKDDIQLASNTAFGVSSEYIHLDGQKNIGLDAEKIWLGKGARLFESQPVILGDSLEVLLNDLFNMLGRLGRRLGKAKTVDRKPIPALNTIGPVIQKASRKYKRRINPKGKSSLKSKKVFVE